MRISTPANPHSDDQRVTCQAYHSTTSSQVSVHILKIFSAFVDWSTISLILFVSQVSTNTMHPEHGIESCVRGKVSTVTRADLKQRDAAVTSVLLRPPRTPPQKFKGYHRSVSLPTHGQESRSIDAKPMHWLWGKKRPNPSSAINNNNQKSDNTNNMSNRTGEDSASFSPILDSHLLLPELFSDDWSEYSDDDDEEMDAESSERLFGLEILENYHE